MRARGEDFAAIVGEAEGKRAGPTSAPTPKPTQKAATAVRGTPRRRQGSDRCSHLAQGVDDLHIDRAESGEEAADEAHHDGKDDPLQYDLGTEIE